jgi:hypothetical protein
MSKQRSDSANGDFGTEMTVPAPKDDDSRLKEQDGSNILLPESEFENRERMLMNE